MHTPPASLALVTGAARRLGKSFAFSLAAMGYHVVLHYHHSKAAAEKTAVEIRALGGHCTPLSANLLNEEEIDQLYTKIDSIGLPIKVVVNSAADMEAVDPMKVKPGGWDATLDLNLRAPFLVSQRAAKRMVDGGVIVNLSDVGAQKTWSRFLSYSVSKAGLESLTRLLAKAWAPSIRVNAIAPGLVLPSDVVSSSQWQALVDKIPLRRSAAVEEITYALEFLIKNEYMTGQTLVVDGGYSLL